MALTATTLAGRKATADVWITLTNPNCVERNMLALVDDEWLLVGNTIGELIGTTPPRPTVGVVPGYHGSTAGPHAQNTPVAVGRPYDFTNIGIVPGGIVTSQSFSTTGSFLTGPLGLAGTTPTANTLVYLTGTGASTFQLSAPTADQRNTLTVLNVGGGIATLQIAARTATLPIGSVLTLRALNGSWTAAATADGGATLA